MTVITTEKHERRHVIQIDAGELERAIAEYAAQQIPFFPPKIGKPGVSFKVTFDEKTEGSPPYRVGTKATVEIIEDMMPQVTERG